MSRPDKDSLYKLLQVEKSATSEEIRKSYLRLALKYHPDKHPEKEEDFNLLSEAYSILSDPTKRQRYDKYGTFASGETYGDWVEFHARIKREDLEGYSRHYVGSKEEEDDIIRCYKRHSGKLTELYETIPFSTSKDIPRIAGIVKRLIQEGKLKERKSFRKELSRMDKIVEETAAFETGEETESALLLLKKRKKAPLMLTSVSWADLKRKKDFYEEPTEEEFQAARKRALGGN